jgi:hypothetical protein
MFILSRENPTGAVSLAAPVGSINSNQIGVRLTYILAPFCSR